MSSESSLVKKLVLFTIFLGIFLFILKSIKNEGMLVSPFSNTANIFSFFKHHTKPKKIVYGYLPWWELEHVKYLQLDKLTDIAYFGFYLNSDGSFKKVRDDDILEPGYNNWIENKDLKKLIKKADKYEIRFAVTVVAHEDDTIDEFLNCQSCWKTLLVNLKEEMNKQGVKNVNINFEHSEQTTEEIAKKFSEFVYFMNSELDKEYGDSFVVVSAFASSTTETRISSDLDSLGKACDGIFIMGYDFHRIGSTNAGAVAPIDREGLDIREMLGEFLAHIPPNKLILGVPYYGYNWVVNESIPNAKVKDVVVEEETELKTEDSENVKEEIKTEGVLSEKLEEDKTEDEGNEESKDSVYSESQTYAATKDMILELKPEVMWDENAKSSYFTYVSKDTNELRQVYYEDERSLREKYRLIKTNDLAGVGIWALGYDEGYTELWNLLYEDFVK